MESEQHTPHLSNPHCWVSKTGLERKEFLNYSGDNFKNTQITTAFTGWDLGWLVKHKPLQVQGSLLLGQSGHIPTWAPRLQEKPDTKFHLSFLSVAAHCWGVIALIQNILQDGEAEGLFHLWLNTATTLAVTFNCRWKSDRKSTSWKKYHLKKRNLVIMWKQQ